MKIVGIILARGGSKGLPKKNILDFCGKPLLCWTIKQLQDSNIVDEIWVSSDDPLILDVAKEAKANTIIRPNEFASDTSTSESAWLHAIENIKDVDVIIAPQITSPLREALDFSEGMKTFKQGNYDSLFSSCEMGDILFWEQKDNLVSVNYDYKNRKRRQDITQRYIENGSFYIFKTNVLKQYSNRFGGKIGTYPMALWKMFEIDCLDSFIMCERIAKSFLFKEFTNGQSGLL